MCPGKFSIQGCHPASIAHSPGFVPYQMAHVMEFRAVPPPAGPAGPRLQAGQATDVLNGLTKFAGVEVFKNRVQGRRG